MTFDIKSLFQRGDRFSIQRGRLVIEPISGKPVPDNWLRVNHKLILCEIERLMGQPLYSYIAYSTGNYKIGIGEKMASGLTLQFLSSGGEEVFCCFNAELTRDRNSIHGKKGSSLPDKHFRVSMRMEFYKFWLRAGLVSPPRLSSFHDYMGNLKPIIFTGELQKGNKLSNKTILPVEISYESLLAAVHADSVRASSIQASDSSRASQPYKEFTRRQANTGVRGESNTGSDNYGNKVISKAVEGDKVIYLNREGECVEEQTIDEWLSDLGDIG